jgi:hypothetical protein
MVSSILILILSVCVVAAAVLLLFRGREDEQSSIKDWELHRNEVYIDLFRVLTQSDQERYLAQSLTYPQFADCQRRRIVLALRILKLVDDDADMLMKLGRQARVSKDLMLAQDAEHLLLSASYLRLNLFLAKCCLRIKWIFPRWRGLVPSLRRPYRKLMDSSIQARHDDVKRP